PGCRWKRPGGRRRSTRSRWRRRSCKPSPSGPSRRTRRRRRSPRPPRRRPRRRDNDGRRAMPETVGYLLLFTGVGVAFILVNLSVGKLIRPAKMDAEKAAVYECGEPTIGSAWVQFDLRFYVVALLFVIFDVEMAFFFPWAVVFGKANRLADPALPSETRVALTD